MNDKITKQIKSTAERIEIALRTEGTIETTQLTQDKNKLTTKCSILKTTHSFSDANRIATIEYITDILTELIENIIKE